MFDRQLVVFKMQFGDTLMGQFVYEEEGHDLHHGEAGIIAKSTVRRQSPYRIPSLLSSGIMPVLLLSFGHQLLDLPYLYTIFLILILISQ
jgi:hypothetical protein